MHFGLSMQPLVFYPFLLLAAGAGIWLLIRTSRKFVAGRGISRLVDLVRRGELERAVRLAGQRGWHQRGADILAAEGHPLHAAELLAAGGYYVAAGERALAAEEVAQAAEHFQRGGDLTTAGICLFRAGDIPGALRLLRQGGDLETAARFLERERHDTSALQLYLEADSYERAAGIAMDRITDRQMLKRAADMLVEAGQAKLALPIYRKGNFLLEAGKVLDRLGRTDAAIELFLRQNHYEEAALLLARTGRHRQAAEYFLKAGVILKAVDELLLAGEYLPVARLFRRSGEPIRALDVLEQVGTESPQFRDARLLACAIQVENHRFDDGEATLKELLEVIGYTTDNIEVISRLVDIQLQLGNRDAAVESLERAKRTGVADPGIDEQLMNLRQTPESLFDPEPPEDSTTLPAHHRARLRGATTTIGFPRSDRYILKRKLARGGHGILFLVEDRKLDQDVVLKLLHSESIPSDLARKYFMREARTAASLNHPNIVRVYDYGEIEGRPYLAMEYVDGLNLIELQESLRHDIPMQRKLAICVELCRALSYAHAKTIIHRDIKMENVMVTSLWQTKLMDFGLAKALNENPDRSLFIIGTPFYMSPEQIVGDALDHRTDIYSLGVLMYRLFTDHLPFEEGEVLSHHRFTAPPDPRTFRRDLPEAIVRIIMTCLNKDRDERFDSGDEIVEALKGVQHQLNEKGAVRPSG